jgi:hypothetical protein
MPIRVHMKYIAFFFFLFISVGSLAADIDRGVGRAWVTSIEKEMQVASKLFAKRPSDAQIGAQSKRIIALRDQGLYLFPLHRDWIECRGTASYSWALWWNGYRATYEGQKGAREATEQHKKQFSENLVECKKRISR